MTLRFLLIFAALTGCKGSNASHSAAERRRWSPAEQIEEDHAEADDHPAVALSGSGDGVVVWQRGSAILARWYDEATQSFGAVSQLTPAARSAEFEVAIDDRGNALLVFARDDSPSNRGIWWTEGRSGSTWSAPKLLSKGAAYGPRLAVSAVGTAIAAWSERSDDALVTARTSDFRDGAWSAVVNTPLLGTDSGERNPRVAIDAEGRGFVIWEQPTAPNQESSIWTERYDGGWLAASVSTLDSYTEDDAYTPELALNEAGAGMAVWLELHGSAPELWSRYFDGSRFGEPERVATAPLIEWDPPPRVALDPAGNCLAIWSQVTSLSEAPPHYDVHAARSRAGTSTWQSPEALETANLIGTDLTEYAGPLVGLDQSGNAIVTWRRVTASSAVRVFSSILVPTSESWLPEGGAALHEDDEHSAHESALAVSRAGGAMAAWSYGPESDIWVSAYRVR